MRRRRWVWVCGAVLILAIIAALSRSIRFGPTIEGQSVRAWVKRLHQSGPSAWREATDALNRAKDPIPICMELLEIQPTQWETTYADLWPRIIPKLPSRLAARFPRPNLDYNTWRSMAIQHLAQLGPKASNSVPALLGFLNATNFYLLESTVRTLGLIGPAASAAVPRLTQILAAQESQTSKFAYKPPFPLRSRDDSILRSAVVSLRQIGVPSEAAVQSLARILNYPSMDLRIEAANAIWKLERQPQRLLPLLPRWFEQLNHAAFDRGRAVHLMAQIAEVEKSALGLLEEVLKDKEIQIRLIASRALWKLDGQTNTHIQVLTDELTEGNESGRWIAVEELASLVGQNEKALSAVTNTLTKDESHRVRGKAAISLGKLGPAASVAIPALTQAFRDEYFNVRDAAAEALKQIDPAAAARAEGK